MVAGNVHNTCEQRPTELIKWTWKFGLPYLSTPDCQCWTAAYDKKKRPFCHWTGSKYRATYFVLCGDLVFQIILKKEVKNKRGKYLSFVATIVLNGFCTTFMQAPFPACFKPSWWQSCKNEAVWGVSYNICRLTSSIFHESLARRMRYIFKPQDFYCRAAKMFTYQSKGSTWTCFM